MTAMISAVIRILLKLYTLSITIFLSETLITYSVKYSAFRIKSEKVFLVQMIRDSGKLFTFEMDQPAAFFTFTVEA